MFTHELEHIDAGRSRQRLRIQPQREVQRTAGRFIVDTVNPYVLEYQRVFCAAQLCRQYDIGGEVRARALIPDPLAQSRGQTCSEDQPVGLDAGVGRVQIGEAYSGVIDEIPTALLIEELLRDQGLHGAGTQRYDRRGRRGNPRRQ